MHILSTFLFAYQIGHGMVLRKIVTDFFSNYLLKAEDFSKCRQSCRFERIFQMKHKPPPK